MTGEYPTLVHRWMEEVWNRKREDAIDEMFAENAVAHGLSDADGKPIDFCGVLMVRLRDGRIIEAWNYYDFLTMFSQLHVLSMKLD